MRNERERGTITSDGFYIHSKEKDNLYNDPWL